MELFKQIFSKGIHLNNLSRILLVSILIFSLGTVHATHHEKVTDRFTPLAPNSVYFSGYLEEYIQNSIIHWNKGVVPYRALAEKFRSGRSFFAQGEMWGKAVRSGCMFYRYHPDPELKKILTATVADLLTTRRSNGTISCSEVGKQPDGPGGDLWERK